MPLYSSSPFFVTVLALTLLHLTWILVVVGILHFSLRLYFKLPERRYAASLFSLACLAFAIPASCWLAERTHSNSGYLEAFVVPTSHLLDSESLTLTTGNAQRRPPISNSELQWKSEAVSPTQSFVWPGDSYATPISVCYFVGFGFMLARLVFMLLASHWLVRNATPVKDEDFVCALKKLATTYGFNTPPKLLTSSKILVPFATGIFRSSILVPSSMLSCLSVYEINSILSHELAHIRRHDALFLFLQRVLETLLFFHPATWWISRNLTSDREYCCDQLVVRSGICPIQYSQTLCRIAELTQQHGAALQTAVAIDGGDSSELVRRIRTLLQPAPQSNPGSSTLSLVLTMAVASMLVLMTTFGIDASLNSLTGQTVDSNAQKIAEQTAENQQAENLKAMEQKYRFQFREHRSDYSEGLRLVKGLIEQAEAEKAPLRLVAQLYYNAGECARFLQLDHVDPAQRSNMQPAFDLLHNVTNDPARFLTDFDTAVWYTNCAGLEAAIMEEGGASSKEIESFLETILTKVNAQANLTARERRLLDCDVRLDIADISINSEKWGKAIAWLAPIFDNAEAFLKDEISAARLAMSARQQSMFLCNAGNHKACEQLVDQMCKKFASAESLPLSARIKNQCMLRGKQFVNYGNGKHDVILKNAIEEYEAIASLAEEFNGPDRTAVLYSCLNMRRLAITRDTISNEDVKATIARTMLLIETEVGLQQGKYAAWWSLSDMVRTTAKKLSNEETRAIKKAIEELKQRLAKKAITFLDQ